MGCIRTFFLPYLHPALSFFFLLGRIQCPNLRMLDFSVVTVADRAAAQFQKKAFDLHMKGRRKKED